MVPVVFDFIKSSSMAGLEANVVEACQNEELCQNIGHSIEVSIRSRKFKIADYVLEYAEQLECYAKRCAHFGSIFTIIMDSQTIMEHLLSQQRVSISFKNSLEATLDKGQNILHYAAGKCHLKIFLGLFSIFKGDDLINQRSRLDLPSDERSLVNILHGYPQINSTSQTPLDIVIQKNDFLESLESRRLFMELIFKLPIHLKLNLSQASFEILCTKFANIEDKSLLLVI